MNNPYGIGVLSEDELGDLLIINPDLDISKTKVDSCNKYRKALKSYWLDWDSPIEAKLPVVSPQEFHDSNRNNWLMPDEYKSLDIISHVGNLAKTDCELKRVAEELVLYEERGLFDLLRYCVYMVDQFKKHGVVWGIGRGSSVSSYVLYLIGIHNINSIEYDLDIHDFLR